MSSILITLYFMFNSLVAWQVVKADMSRFDFVEEGDRVPVKWFGVIVALLVGLPVCAAVWWLRRD